MDSAKQKKIRQKIARERQDQLDKGDIEVLAKMGLQPVDDEMPYEEAEEAIFDGQSGVLGLEMTTDGAKYSLDFKVMAIMFLEIFQREDQESTEMVPKWALVARSLPGNPSESTLRYWWGMKDKILNAPSLVTERMNSWMAIKSTRHLIRMNLALDKVDFNSMLTKNPKVFVYLYNTMVNKFRLFSNQSTANVSNKHTGAIHHVTPNEKPIPPEEVDIDDTEEGEYEEA